MDKSSYISKVNLILTDATKFEKVEKNKDNPIKIVFSLEDKIRRSLQKTFKLVDSNGKRGPTYEFLYPSGTNLGILYGLPKVHKANLPIRPILSAVNTPNYLLAKYLVPNLTPLTKNDFTVHSSFEFAKEIVEMNAQGLHMASFDVTSLFTNIPLQETIDIIISEIFENPQYSNLIECFRNEKYFKCFLPDNESEISYFNKDQIRVFRIGYFW